MNAPLTKARADRNPDDAYATPERLARAICARLAPLIPHPLRVLEPGCGTGPFLRAAASTWPGAIICGVDLHPWELGDLGGSIHTFQGDFLTDTPNWHRGPIGLAIGNPPYLLAEAFARRALQLVAHRGHVAFLLPLTFLSSVQRVPFFREYPLRFLLPIAGRPSFTDDGKTAAAEYAVFAWERGHSGRFEGLAPLEWKEPQR